MTVAVLPERLRAPLEGRLPNWLEPRWWDSPETMVELAPAAEIGWFDMHFKPPVLRSLELARELKWLNTSYAGVDWMPLDDFAARSVTVTCGVGLTTGQVTEFAVLSIVRGNPGINQRALADALAVAPPNLATLLDRLEARGLLARQRSTEDKRVQHVALTAQGVRLYGRALKAAAVADGMALGQLNDAERDQLKTLLRKIFVE